MNPRVVSKKIVNINNPEIERLIGNTTFYSITYRLWKISGLEENCEDYGHIAIYRGGLKEAPFRFILDKDHIFEKDRPERVCGNTALMLQKTRFSKYFDVMGSFEKHFGPFLSCGNSTSNKENDLSYEKSSCCQLS